MTILDCDIAVIGGGLAGLTQALLLAQDGIKTVCIDPRAGQADTRTVALSYGSVQLLRQARIWQELTVQACPITHIDIRDGRSPVLLDFDADQMRDRIDDEPFGWIVELLLVTSLIAQRGLFDAVRKVGVALRDSSLESARDEVSHMHAALLASGRATGVLRVAPAGDGEGDLAVRMFFEANGVREDPATGSANGGLAALHRGAGFEGTLEVTQGVEMLRPSRLSLRVEPSRIEVGGAVWPVYGGAFSLG